MNGHGKALLVCLGIALLCAFPAAAEVVVLPVETLAPPVQPTPVPTAEPVIEREYALGDSGTDVLLFKQRLQYLGYFKEDSSLSNKITEITMERVNQLLADNGIDPVETIPVEVQAMIFWRDDLAIAPTPTPVPTLEPIVAPTGMPELPALDDEGFLAEEDGEYIFEDDEDGLWYYIAHDLYINIRRYIDPEEENAWFEAEVKTRGEEQLESYHEDTRKVYQTPVTIARTNSAVLAFTDDFYTKRSYGVVIRDGEVMRNYIRRTSTSYPLGDTLAVFADGSMLAAGYKDYMADDYLEMGAVQVLSFGPWLLHEGEINPRLLTGEYMHYHEPRCAIGMIEPGHYFVMTVDGRYSGAVGAYIEWLAARMQEVGVTEAINLDGGGTTAMVFMGNQISRVSSSDADGSGTRRVSSMLGFGTSDAVVEP